ncbi:type VII toxin-antitoxin system HepT family RNase toxin [Dictyoglomus thermophilum]|uniref:DUF86 domain-containing protein n=1 Tax=Dictyoglomus thermophilum (strain ATCC 35947 / DSM 3960 / H-6-12) TaxID=309799 RepID=B5YB98_DICT6|nr:DUF86 domain-containing protein [Dictyoglomus thermophilum]ACI19837.1 protein of unknown function [Dictyoglomus thermophilum H-6-12]
MLQFNREKISKLLYEMRRAVSRLDSLSNVEKEEFLKDPDKVDSAKYNFIIAIESAIDICNHIISQNGLRPPKDYSDTFRVLFENGFLEKEFFENLVNMVKFRNRLVHIYWEIDNEFLYSILKNNVKDLKALINKIIEILEL